MYWCCWGLLSSWPLPSCCCSREGRSVADCQFLLGLLKAVLRRSAQLQEQRRDCGPIDFQRLTQWQLHHEASLWKCACSQREQVAGLLRFARQRQQGSAPREHVTARPVMDDSLTQHQLFRELITVDFGPQENPSLRQRSYKPLCEAEHRLGGFRLFVVRRQCDLGSD